MRTSLSLFAFAALLLASCSSVLAQTAAAGVTRVDPPLCAQTCYQAALAGKYSSCTASDFHCLCESADFQVQYNACMQSFCVTVAEIQEGLEYAEEACTAVGVAISTTISTPTASATSGSTTSKANLAAGAGSLQVQTAGVLASLLVLATYLSL